MEKLEYLTVNEVAAERRVAPATVRGWILRRVHGFNPTRVGGRVLIARTDLDAFTRASIEAADAKRTARQQAAA